MIRGGHVDLTVLGALQVDERGTLANWAIPGKMLKGMGGAMDLVAGAKRVFIAMEHATRDNKPKILKKCTLPLTGVEVVDHIVTELAFIEVTPEGLLLREFAPDATLEQVQSLTEPTLLLPPGGPAAHGHLTAIADETTTKTCGRNFSASRKAEIPCYFRGDAALVRDARSGSGVVAGRHVQAHVRISLSVSAESRVRRVALFPRPFHSVIHPSEIQSHAHRLIPASAERAAAGYRDTHVRQRLVLV